MRNTSKALIASALLVACAALLPAQGSHVQFQRLTNEIWLHRSYELMDGQMTASNGIIVLSSAGSVLIDTAWNDEETRQILDFAELTLGQPITACLVTHFHKDRCGGLGAVSERGIRIFMTAMTRGILARTGIVYGTLGLGDGPALINDVRLDIGYFGPAHSPDNIVVWLPDSRLLFAGCLAKSMDSRTIGNTADADLAHWPAVIEAVKARYAGIVTVVPGHGDTGGAELLDHTLELLAAP